MMCSEIFEEWCRLMVSGCPVRSAAYLPGDARRFQVVRPPSHGLTATSTHTNGD